MKITIDGIEFDVSAAGESISVGDNQFEVKIEGEGVGTTVIVNGKRFKVHRPEQAGDEGWLTINVDGQLLRVEVEGALKAGTRSAPARKRARAAPSEGAITSLMPGRIIRLDVEEGQAVEEGDILLVLEAMKMENEIRAPKSGTVKNLAVSKGSSVSAGDVMLEIE